MVSSSQICFYVPGHPLTLSYIVCVLQGSSCSTTPVRGLFIILRRDPELKEIVANSVLNSTRSIHQIAVSTSWVVRTSMYPHPRDYLPLNRIVVPLG